jgi:hypothetical protein
VQIRTKSVSVRSHASHACWTAEVGISKVRMRVEEGDQTGLSVVVTGENRVVGTP